MTGATVQQSALTMEPPWWTLLLGGGLAILTGFELLRNGFAQRAGRVATLLTLLVGVRVLSTLDSLDRYRSQANLAVWLTGLALFFALLIAIENLSQWKAVCAGMVGLASLYSLLVVAPFRASESVLSDTPSLALIPVTAVFLCFSLAGESDSTPRRWLIRALQLLLLVAALRTGSHAAVIGLVTGLLCYTILSSLDSRLALVAFGILVGAVLIVQGPSHWKAGTGSASQAVLLRQEVVRYGWQAAQERALFGSGPGTFALAYQQFRPISRLPQKVYVGVAHNDSIELAVESGIIGLVLWVLILASAIHRGYRFAWFSDFDNEPAGITSALAAMAVFSLLTFALPLPGLVLWTLAMVALTVCLPATPDYRRPWPLAGHLAAGAFLIGGGLWLAQFAWFNQQAAHHLHLAELEESRGQRKRAIEHLEKAGKLAPGRWSIPFEQADLLWRSFEAKSEARDLQRASEAVLRARQASPREIEVLALAGKIHLALGELNQAEDIYRSGAEFAPYANVFPMGLAQVFIERRDYKAAAKQAILLYAADESQLDQAVELLRRMGAKNSDAPADALWSLEIPEARKLKLYEKTEAKLLEAGLFRAADKVRQGWRREYPDEHATELEQIRKMELSGQSDEAYWRLTELANQPPKNLRDQAELLCEWSRRASLRGQRSVATARLQELLKKDPTLISVRLHLVELLKESEQTRQVARIVGDGLKLDKHDPDLLVIQCELFFQENRLDEARILAQKVLTIQPDNQQARHLLQVLESVEGP